ncbi:gustatory receptor 37 [Nasonia vitripennis]|uniref:Gustatory receptor n=1 Tax=Nasonia vitripennis TaxID=7425 RepID=A0A7M6W5V0_NASVI|nr:gustatory receptor 37 [Nasonia vitripennis]
MLKIDDSHQSFQYKLSEKNMITLKRIFYFFKICGLATMKFDSNMAVKERLQGSWFVNSCKGKVYNAILIILLSIATYYVTAFVYDLSISSGEVGKLFDIVSYVFTTITTIVILAVFCLCQKDAVLIANNLRRTHMLIANINSQLSNEKINILRTAKIICIVNLVMLILVFITTLRQEFGIIMYYTTVYPCLFVINFTFLQYSLILQSLKQQFTILNRNFHYVLRQCIMQKNLGATGSSFQTHKVRAQSLSKLCELYASLCDLSTDLSKFYYPTMLFCVLYTFMMSTTWIYYTVEPVIVGKTKLTTFKYIHSLIFLIHHISMLIILSKSVNAVVLENKRTGEITNRGLANMQNQQTINELNFFSNYLLHKNVSFTVYGLFSLDESLLMSITGSITTYIVILLQFQSSVQ